MPGLIHPFDGERRFTSAITRDRGAASALANPGGVGALAAAADKLALTGEQQLGAIRAPPPTMRPSVPVGGVQTGEACTSVLLRIS